MIIHNCIKCDCLELIPIAEGQLPVIQKYTCPECETTQYIKHSRIDPETYSEDMVIVNEKKRSIKIKKLKEKRGK